MVLSVQSLKIDTGTGELDGKLNRKQKRNLRLQIKNAEKTREYVGTQLELAEITEKVLAKEGRLKRYRDMIKLYRQNRTFQNHERKFYQQVGGDCAKTCQQPDAWEGRKLSKL